MFCKLFPLLVISLWGVVVLPLPNRASAVTPLTLAVIQNLQNLVQLMPQNKPKRQAHKSDEIIPGDGLSTGRASLAELRFNDGSLARIGEQVVFRFLPKIRNFRLSNGTMLLLIPPGKGQTRINTPNAAAAIRGSALFVRYDQETDTTIVGALTDSGIQVFNRNASQNQVLKAGQIMVIVKDKFQGLYDFDLRTFYNTSDLVQGLDLNRQSGQPNPDPAIASVQAETTAAIAAQTPITGQGVVENPPLLKVTDTSQNSPSNNVIRDNSPVGTLLETGQVVTNSGQQSENNQRNSNPNLPISGSSEPPTQDINPTPPVVTQPTVETPVLTTTVEPPVLTTTVEPPVLTTTVETPVLTTTVETPVLTTTVETPVLTTTVEPPVLTTTVEPPVLTTTVETPVLTTTVETPVLTTTVELPVLIPTLAP